MSDKSSNKMSPLETLIILTIFFPLGLLINGLYVQLIWNIGMVSFGFQAINFSVGLLGFFLFSVLLYEFEKGKELSFKEVIDKFRSRIIVKLYLLGILFLISWIWF